MTTPLKETQPYNSEVSKINLKFNLNQEFMFSQNIEQGFYGSTFHTYIYEGVNNGSLIFKSDQYGGSSFAVQTNDSHSDGFSEGMFARVIVKPDDFIYIATKETEGIKLVILKVVEVSDTFLNNSVKVKLVNILTNIGTYTPPHMFRLAVDHAVKFFSFKFISNIPQLSPRFCFNPSRSVMIRLFSASENGEYVSYTNEGSRLVMNPWTKEKFPEIEGTNSQDISICRIYHLRKKTHDAVIKADGVKLTELTEESIANFTSSIPKGLFKGELVKVTFSGSNKVMVGIKSINGRIRLVYDIGGVYKSFRLNFHEEDLINKIEPLNIEL